MKFEDISTENDLIAYLDDTKDRLRKRDFLYHYTNLDRVVSLYTNKKWHLGNAKCMNDRLEYESGDLLRWENIFFASFMTDVKENIGMWSMYGQPWDDGVLITIPKKIVVDWVDGIQEIHEVSCDDFRLTGKTIKKDEKNRIFLSSVAYSNCDNPDGGERLTWSTAANTIIKNSPHIPELTGYIKNSAWDYEREIRIKAVLSNGHGFSRVAIDIPDAVLEAITIIPGPLFKGPLEGRLKDEILKKIKVSKSLFSEKLNIGRGCSHCARKVEGNNKDIK